LNVSYFHYDYKDIQVRSSAAPAPPGNVFLLNIAKSTYDGVDVDFSAAVAEGLTINGGFEYLDARFKDYPGASCITPGTGTVSGVTVGLPKTVTCNLAGYQVPNAPKFSGGIGFSYGIQTNAGKFTLSSNDRFNAAYPMTPGGEIRQTKHHIVDASLLWTSPSRSFDINVWARNLLGEYLFSTAQAGRDFIVSPGAPRTYGVTLGAHF
jgi:iron complex outermembrane receptor protein